MIILRARLRLLLWLCRVALAATSTTARPGIPVIFAEDQRADAIRDHRVQLAPLARGTPLEASTVDPARL